MYARFLSLDLKRSLTDNSLKKKSTFVGNDMMSVSDQ